MVAEMMERNYIVQKHVASIREAAFVYNVHGIQRLSHNYKSVFEVLKLEEGDILRTFMMTPLKQTTSSPSRKRKVEDAFTTPERPKKTPEVPAAPLRAPPTRRFPSGGYLSPKTRLEFSELTKMIQTN